MGASTRRQADGPSHESEEDNDKNHTLAVPRAPLNLCRCSARSREIDDQTIIEAVIACIDQGITMKMPLVAAVADAAKVSKRTALRVIERYQGNDGNGLWSYAVQARGAKVYTVVHKG